MRVCKWSIWTTYRKINFCSSQLRSMRKKPGRPIPRWKALDLSFPTRYGSAMRSWDPEPLYGQIVPDSFYSYASSPCAVNSTPAAGTPHDPL